MLKSLSLVAAVLVASHLEEAQTDTTASIVLDGSSISASIANAAISSLRLTDINQEKLRENAPGRTFPEMIRNVPGVYSTSETGSFGDAKINIRGFKQENISVLLNGIPISGLTSGSMYWNNWYSKRKTRVFSIIFRCRFFERTSHIVDIRCAQRGVPPLAARPSPEKFFIVSISS